MVFSIIFDINKRTTKKYYRETILKNMSQGSLLRYDNPVLVSRNDEKKSPASKKFTAKEGIESPQATELKNKQNL